MTPKKLAINETKIALIINLFLSATIAWVTIPNISTIPLIGGPGSAGFGLLMASLIFPLVAGLLITKVIQNKITTGKVQLDTTINYPTLLRLLPQNTFTRSFIVALLFCLVACIVIFILNMMIGNQWSYTSSIMLNIIYVELMTLTATPIIVLTSL